jgi:hypothetical protein
MSDDLPDDERVRRIERGVQRRIDGRRRIAQRIAGASVAVLLVAGGFALLRPVVSLSSGAGGSASSAEGTSRVVRVTCHSAAGTERVAAEEDGLPASAIRACTAALGGEVSGTKAGAQGAGGAPSATPSAPLLCRTTSGALHVYLGTAATCVSHDMTPAPG